MIGMAIRLESEESIQLQPLREYEPGAAADRAQRGGDRLVTTRPRGKCDDLPAYRVQHYIRMAAANARLGRLDEAHRALAEANQEWPYDTVRMHYPDDPFSSVSAAQIDDYQAALRLAGHRDHADEAADFGAASDNVLHADFAGPTPTTAPGAVTIRTAELARLLAEQKPIVIDPMMYWWGRSIPGAIGLKLAGWGGSDTDVTQERLRRKMQVLTNVRPFGTDRRSRLQLGALRRSQPRASPGGPRLHQGLLVSRRPRGLGSSGATGGCDRGAGVVATPLLFFRAGLLWTSSVAERRAGALGPRHGSPCHRRPPSSGLSGRPNREFGRSLASGFRICGMPGPMPPAANAV